MRAAAQVAIVETVLSPYGGARVFSAAASDNTQSCVSMPELIADATQEMFD